MRNDEDENNARNKSRDLDTTKSRQRTSNIHICKARHKNTRTISNGRFDNGQVIKETSGKAVQNRRIYLIGNSIIKDIQTLENARQGHYNSSSFFSFL